MKANVDCCAGSVWFKRCGIALFVAKLHKLMVVTCDLGVGNDSWLEVQIVGLVFVSDLDEGLVIEVIFNQFVRRLNVYVAVQVNKLEVVFAGECLDLFR